MIDLPRSEVIQVYQCSACGYDHVMEFHRLQSPDRDGWTHVGECPNVPRRIVRMKRGGGPAWIDRLPDPKKTPPTFDRSPDEG